MQLSILTLERESKVQTLQHFFSYLLILIPNWRLGVKPTTPCVASKHPTTVYSKMIFDFQAMRVLFNVFFLSKMG